MKSFLKGISFFFLLLASVQFNAMEKSTSPSKFPLNPPANFFRSGHPAVLMNMFINAERSNLQNTYTDSVILDLKEIIEIIENTLDNTNYFDLAYEASSSQLYGLDKQGYRKQLASILKKALAELELRRKKYAEIWLKSEQLAEPSAKKEEDIKTLEQNPAIKQVFSQLKEHEKKARSRELEAAELEERIEANRLYIGLDIKPRNDKEKPILWKETVNSLNAKINNAKFAPNDYFHITIAWYETPNSLSHEFINRVERALSNASQILKIVFPDGVKGISLHDGAVLLGNRKNSVAFRVAESSDLKKLQEILLKFLSFEKIDGFKFNTFEKESPIHVTLGKIKPFQEANQYMNAISTLNAPIGTRASKKEGFTINTFRLTYSLAGQPWQEKMSYKF